MTATANPKLELRVRRDRGSSERLLEAGEELFGKYGLDGASLRQIQLAAGSSNNFAVQYHFGGTAGLAQAILAKRMPLVDAHQAELLVGIESRGRAGDTRALLDAFLRPLLDQRNRAGERSYARFIAALLRAPDGDDHCRKLFHLTPTTHRIVALLRAANPHISASTLSERLRLLSAMVCNSVYNRFVKTDGAATDALLIDDALDMAAAALAFPSR